MIYDFWNSLLSEIASIRIGNVLSHMRYLLKYLFKSVKRLRVDVVRRFEKFHLSRKCVSLNQLIFSSVLMFKCSMENGSLPIES